MSGPAHRPPTRLSSRLLAALAAATLVAGCGEPGPPARYDVVIRGGLIHDGSGSAPYVGDIALSADTIAAISSGALARGGLEIEAGGLAVAPGFINVNSLAGESLLEDGSARSDVQQGVTLLVLPGERRWEPGDTSWTGPGAWLELLAGGGVAANVATYVGATALRVHVLGYDDRPATRSELDEMRVLARQGMREGALGIASSLDQPPGSYADTRELIALAEIAAEFQGVYSSRIRSGGDLLLQAVEELVTVASEAQVRAEIRQLRVTGRENWSKLDSLVRRVSRARDAGVTIGASTDTYAATRGDLADALPPWFRDAEAAVWLPRLSNPEIRRTLMEEMAASTDLWESPYRAAGSADRVLLAGFRNPELRPLAGTTLADVAARRDAPPEATAIELMIEDQSPVGAFFFIRSEENIAAMVRQEWMSFGSGAPTLGPPGSVVGPDPHPAAYGNFARLLARYVREAGIIDLPEAIRRLTSLPAANLGLARRGALRAGFFADIVVFDPDSVQDHADYGSPHRYATGVHHVLVNGKLVLRDGEHTGARPGRALLRSDRVAGERGNK